MGQTDLAVRLLAERHLADIVPALLPGHEVIVRQTLRTEVKLVERTSDELVRADVDGTPTILHVEFQSTPRADLPLRMLEYHALLAARHAPLAVRSIVVYLMHEPPTGGEPRFDDGQMRFACDVFRPWETPLTLRDVAARPTLAPLAVLTPGITERELEQVFGIVEQTAALSEHQRGDLLTVLYVLARRRFPHDVLDFCLRSKAMIDSPGYQDIIERGIKQGLERGIEQGLERGIEQGLERGRRAMCARNLLTVVRKKLGQVPDGLEGELAALDEERLVALLEAVIDAPDAASARQLLPPLPR